MTSSYSRILAVGLAAFSLPTAAFADKVLIKLGTLAPEGSEWHNALSRIGQRWKAASGETVELKIFPGGVAGDEGDMVRKTRIGQLHAATITNVGLGTIHKATLALQTPMLFQSWEELDYVRNKISPDLEKELAEKGYVVLNWGDAGWVHFFGVKPISKPDDLRKLKLFVWTGDPDSENAWKKAKFTVVPVASTEVLPGLKTGMLEALQTTPVFALTSQWYASASNMCQVNWAPLTGATVVTKKQWDKIDPKYQAELLKIAREEGDVLRNDIRKLSDEALKTMISKGLKVSTPDAAGIAEWQKVADLAYPDIRGKVVPEKYFDDVMKYRNEFRAGKK